MELPFSLKLVECYVRPERGVVTNKLATCYGDLVPEWSVCYAMRRAGEMEGLGPSTRGKKANHGPTTSVIEHMPHSSRVGEVG